MLTEQGRIHKSTFVGHSKEAENCGCLQFTEVDNILCLPCYRGISFCWFNIMKIQEVRNVANICFFHKMTVTEQPIGLHFICMSSAYGTTTSSYKSKLNYFSAMHPANSCVFKKCMKNLPDCDLHDTWWWCTWQIQSSLWGTLLSTWAPIVNTKSVPCSRLINVKEKKSKNLKLS